MTGDPVGEIAPAHATESEEEDESPPIEEHDIVHEEQDEELTAGSEATQPDDVELLFFLRDEVRNAQAQTSA